MSTAAKAYLDLPADDRLEARLPRRLKADAERVAKAQGQTLSQWLVHALAERVSAEYGAVLEWQLTPDESAMLLHVLAQPQTPTPELQAAHRRAIAALGDVP
jgi:uncharacterized protein (DUF1778 family)